MTRSWSGLAAAALLLCCSAGAVAGPKHAPLPGKIMEAKTVYIENQSGVAKLEDSLYRSLQKWGRYEVVEDRDKADLVFALEAGGTNLSGSRPLPTIFGGGWREGRVYLTIVDRATGEPLWSESKGANALTNGVGGLVGELRRRIEEQEKNARGVRAR